MQFINTFSSQASQVVTLSLLDECGLGMVVARHLIVADAESPDGLVEIGDWAGLAGEAAEGEDGEGASGEGVERLRSAVGWDWVCEGEVAAENVSEPGMEDGGSGEEQPLPLVVVRAGVVGLRGIE